MLAVHDETHRLLRAPSQSVQSAVVIGLGSFGRDVLAQLATRYGQYIDDSLTVEPLGDPAVHTLTLYDCPEPDATAVDIRVAFLTKGLLDTRARIGGILRAATAHAERLAVPHLEPVVYVIGATWEPTGSALLWPIAYLIGRMLGWHMDYQVIGIFTSAHHVVDPEEQELGNALTFATLVEGDALRQRCCDWEHPIDRLLPVNRETKSRSNRRLYDQIYLLDTLKSNNTTVLTGNVAEIVLATTMLVESLVSAPVHQVVDAAVLDDFARSLEQVYTGVGIAALTVPVGEIRAVLEQDALTSLVTARLVSNVDDAALGRISSGLINDLEHQCHDYYRNRIGEAFEELNEHGIPLSHAPESSVLRFKAGANFVLPEGLPQLRHLAIHGPSPFAAEHSMQLQAVLDRLEEEIDAGTSAIRLVEQQFDLEHERRKFLLSLDTQCEHAVGQLLLKGDAGLSEAVVFLRLLRDGLLSLVERERKDSSTQELRRRARRLQDQVHGESRWIFDTRRLRPILVRRPRIVAVAGRSLLLLALLYQFYWDAVTRDVIFWPLSLPLVANFIDRFSTHGWPLFILLALVVGAVALIFVGVPSIALRTAFLVHRRTLAAHVTAHINLAIRERVCSDLESRAAEMGYQHDRLLVLQQALRTGAGNSQQWSNKAGEPGAYLEMLLVRAVDVARAYHDQVVRSVLERSPRGLVDSWLYNPYEPNWETKTAAEILAQLRERIAPVVRQIVFQPIEDYLGSSTTEDWLYHLWRVSTPWVKPIGFTSSVGDAEPLEVNVVIAPADADASLRRAAQIYGSYTEALVWPEPYRIYMLRMLAGITGSALARFNSLQQAFQLQPASIQAAITADLAIRSQYSALLPEPDIERQTEPDPPIDIESQPETATRLVDTSGSSTTASSATSETLPTDKSVSWSHMQNVIREFEQGIMLLEKSVADGFSMGLKPVHDLVYSAVSDEPIDARMLLNSLSELEESRSANDLTVRQHLSEAFEQLEVVLHDLGVEYIDPPIGEPFDPRYAEPASLSFDDGVPVDHVLKVTRRGYRDRTNGLVLTPAKVIVSLGAAPPPSKG